MNVFGFTLLRNGIKYDYSFRECLGSLKPICKSIYVAVGKSEDGTEEAVKELEKIVIIDTVWNEELREGALILSQQTNIALEALRADYKDEPESWGIYLQCDEVLHEEDYDLILEDLRKAEDSGCDSMTFRYLHFWMDHHHVAINKKWYPQEIRAVKLNSRNESWGDAQGFRNGEKVYHSEARVYHYGHVREENKYKKKKADIMLLYHQDDKLAKYKRREKRYDNATETLLYFGKHPEIMKERIMRFQDPWTLSAVAKVHIVGEEKNFDPEFINRINSDEIVWCRSIKEVPKSERQKTVILEPKLMDKLIHRSDVPVRMKSKIARDWSPEFLLTMKLSERLIGLKG
ncbi:MAG: hypothetical protein HN576_10640 [Bacteriovoracaceae bacterium]|jgi:hypothetical protein|nr:hypothetical protein [Bacteriovoracaceae bacterium]